MDERSPDAEDGCQVPFSFDMCDDLAFTDVPTKEMELLGFDKITQIDEDVTVAVYANKRQHGLWI